MCSDCQVYDDGCTMLALLCVHNVENDVDAYISVAT
jgi:hypothetical protein